MHFDASVGSAHAPVTSSENGPFPEYESVTGPGPDSRLPAFRLPAFRLPAFRWFGGRAGGGGRKIAFDYGFDKLSLRTQPERG
jgi:hypothetical protein